MIVWNIVLFIQAQYYIVAEAEMLKCYSMAAAGY